jgi:hypothetical protein
MTGRYHALWPTIVAIHDDVLTPADQAQVLSACVEVGARMQIGPRPQDRAGYCLWDVAPATRPLFDAFRAASLGYLREALGNEERLEPRLLAWVNVYRLGDHIGAHMHNSDLTGMYFASVGPPGAEHAHRADSGHAVLIDQRGRLGYGRRQGGWHPDHETVHFAGAPGRMILHPGGVSHYVAPYFGDAPMVVVSCDIDFWPTEDAASRPRDFIGRGLFRARFPD